MKPLPVEKPVVRNNYTFQVVDPTTNRPMDEKLVDRDELGWSSTMNFQQVTPLGTVKETEARESRYPRDDTSGQVG